MQSGRSVVNPEVPLEDLACPRAPAAVQRWQRGEPSPGADVAGVGPVPVLMWQRASPVPVWQGWAQSPLVQIRQRASLFPVQTWEGVSPVPVQMWRGWAQSPLVQTWHLSRPSSGCARARPAWSSTLRACACRSCAAVARAASRGYTPPCLAAAANAQQATLRALSSRRPQGRAAWLQRTCADGTQQELAAGERRVQEPSR
jgi:hypothetical protein